jgi:hypothetical protein
MLVVSRMPSVTVFRGSNAVFFGTSGMKTPSHTVFFESREFACWTVFVRFTFLGGLIG